MSNNAQLFNNANFPSNFPNTSTEDRLIFVKLIDEDSEPRGVMILSDSDMLENGGTQVPIGCFIAP
jgi:hypothetical protein